MSDRIFCVVEACRPIKGSHLDDCDSPDDQCRGCLPRLAEPDLRTCTACRLRSGDQLTELGIGVVHAADNEADSRTLPSLWHALLQPSRIASVTRGPGGDEVPTAMSDGALEARTAIEQLARRYGSAYDAMSAPAGVPEKLVSVLRFLRHWLAQDEAGEFVRQVDEAYALARRRAYPQPPRGTLIGSCPVGRPSDEPDAVLDEQGRARCGGDVRAIVEGWDEDGWASCRKCGTRAVIAWWLAQMPPEVVDWMTMRALRWHLLIQLGRSVGEKTIRSWAHRWQLDDRCDLRSKQTEYRVRQALELARDGRRGRHGSTPSTTTVGPLVPVQRRPDDKFVMESDLLEYWSPSRSA